MSNEENDQVNDYADLAQDIEKLPLKKIIANKTIEFDVDEILAALKENNDDVISIEDVLIVIDETLSSIDNDVLYRLYDDMGNALDE